MSEKKQSTGINLNRMEAGDQLVLVKSFDGPGKPCRNGSVMFAVKHDDDYANLFIDPNELNSTQIIEELTNVGARESLTIYLSDDRKSYELATSNKGSAKNGVAYINSKEGSQPEVNQASNDYALKSEVKTYDIHVQVAAKLAAMTFGSEDKYSHSKASKRTDQWLSIITDHYSRILESIKEAKSIFHLRGLKDKYSPIWSVVCTEQELDDLREVYIIMEESLLAKESEVEPGQTKNKKEEQPSVGEILKDKFVGSEVSDADIPF